jgi:hypothetical protein
MDRNIDTQRITFLDFHFLGIAEGDHFSVVDHPAHMQNILGIEVRWLETNRRFATQAKCRQQQHKGGVRLLQFIHEGQRLLRRQLGPDYRGPVVMPRCRKARLRSSLPS